MQWLAAFHRALNNVHSAVSQHNSGGHKGSRCSIFIFGLLARPERVVDAHASRQPQRRDSQNHKLTPPVYVRRRDGRDQTEQPKRGTERGNLGRLGLGARRLLGEEDERLARRRPDQS